MREDHHGARGERPGVDRRGEGCRVGGCLYRCGHISLNREYERTCGQELAAHGLRHGTRVVYRQSETCISSSLKRQGESGAQCRRIKCEVSVAQMISGLLNALELLVGIAELPQPKMCRRNPP